ILRTIYKALALCKYFIDKSQKVDLSFIYEIDNQIQQLIKDGKLDKDFKTNYPVFEIITEDIHDEMLGNCFVRVFDNKLFDLTVKVAKKLL
ncbi:MAG: hypothetical protein GXP61_02750, partial [Epsilonproteobacteria bacterium]|nr:hypothetical protein [Campylobacterota bacterium]